MTNRVTLKGDAVYVDAWDESDNEVAPRYIGSFEDGEFKLALGGYYEPSDAEIAEARRLYRLKSSMGGFAITGQTVDLVPGKQYVLRGADVQFACPYCGVRLPHVDPCRGNRWP